MSVQVITEEEFEENILNESKVVLLDFWREGCGPCKALLAELDALSGSQEDIRIYKANVDTETALAERLRVMAAPTLFFFKDGEIRKKTIGFKSRKSILEAIGSIERE